MINVPPDWEDTLMCDMNRGTLSTSSPNVMGSIVSVRCGRDVGGI
jgi:hypothetical protein